MSAAMAEGPTFPLASLANWLFHASKPADVLPHCAAPASPAVHTSALKAATATVLNGPPVVIQNSFSARHLAGTSRPLSPSRSPSTHPSCQHVAALPRGIPAGAVGVTVVPLNIEATQGFAAAAVLAVSARTYQS